jgi:hypothetical protein
MLLLKTRSKLTSLILFLSRGAGLRKISLELPARLSTPRTVCHIFLCLHKHPTSFATTSDDWYSTHQSTGKHVGSNWLYSRRESKEQQPLLHSHVGDGCDTIAPHTTNSPSNNAILKDENSIHSDAESDDRDGYIKNLQQPLQAAGN